MIGPSTLPDSVAEFNQNIPYPHSFIRSRILRFLLGAVRSHLFLLYSSTVLRLCRSPTLALPSSSQVAKKLYGTYVHKLLYSPTQTALWQLEFRHTTGHHQSIKLRAAISTT